LTVTVSVVAVVDISEIAPIETPLWAVYTEGILSTNSIVSHLVGCSPYSKSVSIRFWGFDTLNL